MARVVPRRRAARGIRMNSYVLRHGRRHRAGRFAGHQPRPRGLGLPTPRSGTGVDRATSARTGQGSPRTSARATRRRRTAPDRRRSSTPARRAPRAHRRARRGGRDRDARRPRRAAAAARCCVISATSPACASTSPISSAFCSPVEAWLAAMPFGPYSTSRSVRCGPSVVRPAAASRARFVAQHRAVAILHLGRGQLHQGVLDPSVERDAGPGKRRSADRDCAAARQRAAAPSRRAPPRPRSRPRRSRARSRRASARRGFGCSSSRLRERKRRSSALTRLECVPSTASTRRSRKRRRSDAGPPNRPSIAGVSHTTLT